MHVQTNETIFLLRIAGSVICPGLNFKMPTNVNICWHFKINDGQIYAHVNCACIFLKPWCLVQGSHRN